MELLGVKVQNNLEWSGQVDFLATKLKKRLRISLRFTSFHSSIWQVNSNCSTSTLTKERRCRFIEQNQ